MITPPSRPQCSSKFSYEDGANYVYPECAREWPRMAATSADEKHVIRDSNGNMLQDGGTVILIKSLKIRGSSSVVKVSTKVKNIRLVDGDHDIDCKIDGINAMSLKSEFVRKS